MSFFTIVVKNLLRRPTRSALTVAGIAVGVGAVVALASVAWGFERSWTRIYMARGADLIVTKAGSLSPSPPVFAQAQVRRLASLPRVLHSSGIMSELMSIEDAPIMLVFGWESGTFVWDHLRLVSGRAPADDSERTVILGALSSDVLRKSVGSPIEIQGDTFTVSGIFDSASLVENGAVVMALPQLQRITEQPGKVAFLNLKLAPGTTASEIEAVRRSIMAQLPGFQAFTVGDVAESNTAIQAAKAISWATSAIALLVGAVGVTNTVLMSVFERVHEIGILLAVGWRRGRIVRMVLYESVTLSLVGGLVGTIAGTVIVRLLEVTPLLRGRIEGEFSVALFAVAFAISVGLGVIGGLYPALRGSRMRPSEALRYE